MMRALKSIVRRDLALVLREGGALGTALGFYMVVVALLPLGLGPDLKLLTRIAPGVLWIALLLAALLSLGSLFERDFEDGTLDAIAMGPLPLELVCGAKALAHWISTGIPLTLMAPVLGLLLNLEESAYVPLVVAMLAGTPAISFIGSIAAALTLKARRGGLLVALLVLPLYVPTLIYGIASVSLAQLGEGATSTMLIVVALSLGSAVLGPIAAAAALRIQMQ